MSFLLLENGSFLLQENSSRIVLVEEAPADICVGMDYNFDDEYDLDLPYDACAVDQPTPPPIIPPITPPDEPNPPVPHPNYTWATDKKIQASE